MGGFRVEVLVHSEKQEGRAKHLVTNANLHQSCPPILVNIGPYIPTARVSWCPRHGQFNTTVANRW